MTALRLSVVRLPTGRGARFTEVRSPETIGFCECFHRTLKEEFFTGAFRGTLCESLDQLKRNGSLPGVVQSGASPSRIPEPKDENPTRRSWKVRRRCLRSESPQLKSTSGTAAAEAAKRPPVSRSKDTVSAVRRTETPKLRTIYK